MPNLTPDVANLGLVRPPVVCTVAVVVGFALGSAWPVGLPLGCASAGGTVVLAMGVMQWVVVRREERDMTQRFGDEYVAYLSSVRRWL